MPRMIFIEPKAPNLHIYSQYTLPRLGILLLGTMMRHRGWDVEIIIEETQAVDYLDIENADMVGISTITSTAPRAYLIADRIRAMGIQVMMGGPHVTFLPEEALNHADYVIRGEGETALMAFIDAWEGDNVFSSVPNLSYRTNGRSIHNPIASPQNDLDSLPFPDISDWIKKAGRIAGLQTIPIQTSRGCPFECSFCSVTGMFGKKYRFRSTENIIEELRLYDDPKNTIFFYDDNFTANPKRAKELLRAMIREKFRFKWTTQTRADVAEDTELVKLMKKAGCHTLYIGFESVNPKSLTGMKKKQTVEEIRRATRILLRYGIHIHGMFVFGFDEDDWQTVKKTVRFAKKTRLNSSQFLILTPLPGSEFYDNMSRENRFMFNDWSLYDAHHVVFAPMHFSAMGLQMAQIFGHKKFYSRLQSLKKSLCFQLFDVAIARYARRLNKSWKKRNLTFLKVIDLLSSKKNAQVQVDYKQEITLDP